MRLLYNKYYQLIRNAWLILIEYRGETFFYMMGSFISPLVTLAVWMAVAGDGKVSGYGQADFIRYFLAVMFIMRLTATWDVWEMDMLIREGTLSSYLVRPFNPIHWRIAEHAAYKLFYLVLMMALWGVACIFYPVVRLDLHGLQWLAVAWSILVAIVIRYMFNYCFGLLAFWTNRSTSIFSMVEGFALFLRGMVAPLALFPPLVRTIAEISPFYWMLGFPVDLMTRPWADMQIARGFLVQAGWLFAVLLLYTWMWKAGLKKYGAVGG